MKRFTPAWLAVCLACSFSPSLAADALETRAFQGMPADFIKGADISTLLDAEKHGATFYDQNNQRKDPIAILKENGVNYVRLRLWVDPHSASGEGYGGGNNDLATTGAGETRESPGNEAAARLSLQRFLDRSRQAVQTEGTERWITRS